MLHFWSLGVEEQFYLVWPALLTLVAGTAFAAGDVRRGIRRVRLAVVLVLGLSILVSWRLTEVAEPWAFFMLPARAWELGLGALLALPSAAGRLPAAGRAAAGWIGLGMIVLAGIAFGAGTPFPGTAALLPVVGAGLVIVAGLGPDAAPAAAHSPLAPTRLLARGPLRFLGRISYSLYLWHWPILVLPAAALGPLPGPVRVALALAAVPVAAASQRWVEEPVRRGRVTGLGTRRSLGLAGATTAGIAGLALAVGTVSTLLLGPAGPRVGGSLDEVPLPAAVLPAAPAPSAAGPASACVPGGRHRRGAQPDAADGTSPGRRPHVASTLPAPRAARSRPTSPRPSRGHVATCRPSTRTAATSTRWRRPPPTARSATRVRDDGRPVR